MPQNEVVIGANSGKNKLLYKAVFGKNKTAILDYAETLAMNPSHRWITFPILVNLSHLWITKRQANWLVSMVHTKLQAKDFSLELVQPKQS